MATLTPIAGPAITVTAVTGVDAGAGLATFSGSSFNTLPSITGVNVVSATVLTIPTGRISQFA